MKGVMPGGAGMNYMLGSLHGTHAGAHHFAIGENRCRAFFRVPTPKAKVRPLTYDGDDGVIWYTFEPLGDTTGSADDPFAGEICRSLIPILSQAPSDIDLQWYKQVMNEWFVTPEGAVAACQNMPPHVKRIPQLFLACDVKRSKRILKAYLFPVLKHSPCIVESMAIDCIDPSKARVKVYARRTSNSKCVLVDVFTLGGTQTDEATLKGVEAAEKLKQGEERIDIKAHLPWGRTAHSDAQAIENFMQAKKYYKGASATADLPGRDNTKPGGSSYVSYNYNENRPYLSSYFTPQILGN
ncbi:hypothetical protein LZ32DRAFT_630664 [Colletotrichum eremochloae]|nr:hypothetical protein LZ32DRAFT_630664 [Colletotrichum eremochloae]